MVNGETRHDDDRKTYFGCTVALAIRACLPLCECFVEPSDVVLLLLQANLPEMDLLVIISLSKKRINTAVI